MVIIYILLIYLILACIFGSNFATQKYFLKLPFPDADFDSVLWMNGKLVAFKSDPITFSEQGDSIVKILALPHDDDCIHSTHYYASGVFPDGRLQIIKLCVDEPRTKTFLMAYDWNNEY